MLAVNATSALRRQARAASCMVGAGPRASFLNTLSSASSPTGCSPSNNRFQVQVQWQQVHQTRNLSSSTIHKFDISPQQLETVKATLPLVGKAGTAFTKHFYTRMFAAHPELLNVFNQTNQTMGKQPQKLLKTVAVAAQMALDTGEMPGEAIESISQKHCACGVTKEAYDVVGEHLLGTIEDLLTDDKTVLDAWGALYGNIAGAFVQRESEISAEAANTPGMWAGKRAFDLVEKEKLSRLITRFKFKPADGMPIPKFAPGAYTTVWAQLEDEEGPYGFYTEQPRHYTLALPRDGKAHNHLSISVKKEGLVSRMLHGAVVGSKWELSAPFGCFTMSGVEDVWLSDPDTPVVFLSAGVGITPVLAMLENIFTTRPATWLHAAKNGDVHAYRDRLREIASVRAGGLQRRVWYDKPLPADGVPGGDEKSKHLYNVAKYHYKGRMDLTTPELAADEELLHLDHPNASYFMCGPEPFMDAQREGLMKLGVSLDRIHGEGF